MTLGARRLAAARLLATGLLLIGVAGGVLSACSGAVEVAPPAHAAHACDRADARWPATLAGRDRRAIAPSSPDAAAWGDPAVIATCGWPAPGPTTEQCVTVDGVDWIVHQLSDGVRFLTFGRDPALEVLVPHAYAPEPLLLPAFGSAARSLPATGHTCS
jgi:Protein of unknown function (DUF3515)